MACVCGNPLFKQGSRVSFICKQCSALVCLRQSKLTQSDVAICYECKNEYNSGKYTTRYPFCGQKCATKNVIATDRACGLCSCLGKRKQKATIEEGKDMCIVCKHFYCVSHVSKLTNLHNALGNIMEETVICNICRNMLLKPYVFFTSTTAEETRAAKVIQRGARRWLYSPGGPMTKKTAASFYERAQRQ